MLLKEEERRSKMLDQRSIKSAYCEKCSNKDTCVNGCDAWRAAYIRNWNKNICRKPKKKETPAVQKSWQYEHPDLVREGITFVKSNE